MDSESVIATLDSAVKNDEEGILLPVMDDEQYGLYLSALTDASGS